jgi:hypothetical protein
MSTLPPLLPWQEIHKRLPDIFPEGTPNRDNCVWEIAARTIFVMLYTGAVEGSDVWIRPDQVTRMTDEQSQLSSAADRISWITTSMRPSKADVPGRWYATNTRESIRDDTIKNSLIPNGAVIDRVVSTTSSAGRYALQAGFAALLDPAFDEETFQAQAEAWRAKHLNAGALARIAIVRKGAVAGGDSVLVTFPSGETRRMTPGESAEISKAVIETFAPRFLVQPAVVSLSESGNKVVARDDQLAKAIGLIIPPDKYLPDIVLVDLGPEHPLLVFVEVVWSDGPVNEARKKALTLLAGDAGFAPDNLAFVTAFLDRGSRAYKKTAPDLAWGSYAWFASEPTNLVILSDSQQFIGRA